MPTIKRVAMRTNRHSNQLLLVSFALMISLSLIRSALAVEGRIGRPISGMQIAPYAGLIPPEPG
jgi:hypothetical protein